MAANRAKIIRESSNHLCKRSLNLIAFGCMEDVVFIKLEESMQKLNYIERSSSTFSMVHMTTSASSNG